jgi:magnesium transporter
MNFDNMPELHWHYGYFGALGAMALLALVLARFLKRRGWL